MKICVFKVGAIGDVLMSTPFLKVLRKQFPDATIDFWVGRTASVVLENNKNVNNVHDFDENVIFRKRLFSLLGLVRRIRKEKYDLAFVLDKSWHFGILMKLTGIPERIGFDRSGEGRYHTKTVPYGPRKHEVEYYLELAYLVGAKKVKKWKLDLNLKEELSWAKAFLKEHKLRQPIGIAAGGAINPGQNMPSRRWPFERFEEVARRLKRQILWLGAPSDPAGKIGVSSVGKTSVRQSAALMKSCCLVITNDAGPMHLAAAAGTKVVAVFGPTDPMRKAPPGSKWLWNEIDCDRAEVFADYTGIEDNILKVSVKEVLAAVRSISSRP